MKILWGVYVIIGLAAFILSFLIQGYVFSKISDMLVISFIFASIFEGAKVMTIIVPHFQSEKNEHRVTPRFRAGVNAYRLLLLLVSIGCSISMLANFLDKPNFDKILETEKKMIENNYKENEQSLNKEFEKNMTNLTKTKKEIAHKYQDRYTRLAQYYEPRIEKEERLRDAEFENVINNVRKGPRWHEHNRKIEFLTTAYLDEQKQLWEQEDQEIKSIENKIKQYFLKKSEDLRAKRATALAGVENRLQDDNRTNNQMILSLISTLKKGFDVTLSYDFLVVMFAIITAVLLEGTIYVIFNYVSITHHEIFSFRQDMFVVNEKLRAEAESELHKDNINFESRKNRIKTQMNNLKDNVFNYGTGKPVA